MPLLFPDISKDFPGGITLESLYQIKTPSIWFLIWILKKNRFWPDLTRVVLEEPFKVKRRYWSSGQMCFVEITKNNKLHGVQRRWYENGKLAYECYLKDGKEHGIYRCWYKNGQLEWESHWKDGQQDGIARRWYENGQLINESHWKDGRKMH